MTQLAVEYAELEILAATLRGHARQISDEALMLTQAIATPDIAQAALIAPVEAAATEAAIASAALRADLLVIELEARALAVATAAELYRLIDQALAAGLSAADAAADWAEETWEEATGWAEQTWEEVTDWVYEEAIPFLIETAVHRLIIGVQALALATPMGGFIGFLTGGHWPTTSHEQAAAGLLALLENGGIDTDPDLGHDPLADTGYPDGAGVRVSRGDLMNFEETAYNDAHPQIVVTTVIGADGETRHIVNIPGTEMKMPLGPTGLDTDLATLDDAGATTEGERAELVKEVVAVMRKAGLNDGGEVLISGHSLGGMAAASIASDPALVEEFNIQGIATQGSPIANYPVDSRVDVLAIEHSQDLIPHLDGADNPDRPNWTTLAVDDPQRAANPLDAHKSDHYEDTIEKSSDGRYPEVDQWFERNQGFFGTATDQQAAPIYEK